MPEKQSNLAVADDANARPRPRSRRLAAWVAIALCLGIVAVARWRPGAGKTPPQATALGAEMAGRYAIGTARFAAYAPAPANNVEMPNELLLQLDRSLTTPQDGLRAVPIAAELRGAEEAVRRLDALRLPPDAAELEGDRRLLRTVYTGGVSALSETERERIAGSLGWSGRLALTWGAAETDPARRAVMRQAMRTFVAGMAAILAGLAALAGGVVLAIVAIGKWRAGKMPAAFVAPAAAPGNDADLSGFLIEAFAVYLVWFVGAGAIGRFIAGGRWPWFWTVLSGLAPAACLWPLARRVRFGDLQRSLGWTRGAGVWREAGLGLLGYVAGLPLMVAGIFITVVLAQASGVQPSHPAMGWIVWDFRRLLGVLALVSIYAPLAEETMFRGALYGGLRGRRGSLVATMLVAFIFAALHPQGWTAIPALMSIAIVLAMLREWRGSSIASMTAHALNNAVVTVIFALIAG